MAESKVIEGPAGFCNFTPDGAESLPTWHPPASATLANSSQKTSIAGPAHEGYASIPKTKHEED